MTTEPASPPQPLPAPADPTVWPKAIPLLVLAGLLAYSNSFTKTFIFDDIPAITGNPALQTNDWSLSWGGRPLIRLSILVNYKFGGFQPMGYHAVNLAVHILAGLTLYGLVRRCLLLPRFRGEYDTSASHLAFAVALLWLVHPLQTQSVTYIIQRCESMMGLFYLFTLYAWLRGATTRKRYWYPLGVLSFALSWASKEVAITLPVMLVIFDRVFLAGSWRELVRERRFPYLGILVLWAAMLRSLFGLASGGGEAAGVGFTINSATPYQYLLTQAGVIVHYLRLSVWPVGQALDCIDWPVAKSFGEVWWQFLVIAGLFAVSVVLLFLRPALGFVGVWFFVVLAPTSSIVPVIDPAFEHRMYLSLASVVIVVVFGVHTAVQAGQSPERIKAVTEVAALSIAAIPLIALTFARNETYRSPIAAWEANMAVRPNNPRPMAALAVQYIAAGQLEKADAIIRQAEELQSTFNVGPIQSRASFNARIGRLREAERGYVQLASAPFNVNSTPGQLKNLAWIQLALGRPDVAAFQLRTLIANRPGVGSDYLQLAALELAAGRETEARAAAAEAARLDPLGGRIAGAEARQYVLARDPQSATLTRPMALALAAVACLIDGDKDPMLLDTLAMCYAWNEQFPKAAEAARRGVAAADARGDADWAAALKARMKLYEAGRPYTAPVVPGKKS